MGNIADNGAQATVRKPEIYIVTNDGDVRNSSVRVDHARTTPPASTIVIDGVTTLDKTNILTFNNSVRIIITGQVGSSPNYVRRNGGILDDLNFEGNATFDTGGENKDLVNYFAETWYTLNGKDPIRGKAQFYNFKNMDDYNGNYNEVGFVLRTNPTGSNLVTLKSKTYYHNEESAIAIAIFKIAVPRTNLEFYQTPQ